MNRLLATVLMGVIIDASASVGTITGTVQAQGRPGTDAGAAGGMFDSSKLKFAERVNYAVMHDFFVHIDPPPTPAADGVLGRHELGKFFCRVHVRSAGRALWLLCGVPASRGPGHFKCTIGMVLKKTPEPPDCFPSVSWKRVPRFFSSTAEVRGQALPPRAGLVARRSVALQAGTAAQPVAKAGSSASKHTQVPYNQRCASGKMADGQTWDS